VLESLRDYDHTLVFYLSKWKAAKHIAEMLDILGNREAVLCRELTKVHEEFFRASLAAIKETLTKSAPRGEIVLVVSK